MGDSAVENLDFQYGGNDEKENNNLRALTGDTAVTGTIFAKETHDFGSLADGVGETGTMPVVGASLGDFVEISFSLDLQDMILTAYVSAADVVEYRLQNESTATVNLASGTIRVLVKKVDQFA